MAVTVLMVDDHSGFRACARQLLEVEGFQVVGEAADAASAMDAVVALHPDLVLLDVQLPDIDGLEASKRIHAMNGGSAIVLISSCDVSDLGRALADSPALGFVPKSELSGEALRTLLASDRAA